MADGVVREARWLGNLEAAENFSQFRMNANQKVHRRVYVDNAMNTQAQLNAAWARPPAEKRTLLIANLSQAPYCGSLLPMRTPAGDPAHSKKVGIWIRVSTEDQAAGDSPEHHEARARHYAASRGWNVAALYNLAGVSGKAVMEHAETKRMMADIKRGEISGLIFSKLARLTRNARELMDFSDYFRTHDADLISLQESIDTSTPSGRLFYNMVSIMAQWEREEITDRVRASVAIRAKLGKSLGGKSAYGYVWKEKRLQPDPNETPVRKLIYDLFLEHKRKKTVARILNDRGYRTRNGGKWTDTTIDRLIRDTTAKGVYRANYTRRVDDKSYTFKPEHEWVLSEVPAIITEDLWQRCNDILEGRKVRRERPGRRPVHLFSGLVICECGKKVYVPSNTPKYVCPGCRNKIPIVDLDGLFMDELKSYLLSPTAVAEYVRKAGSAISEKEEMCATLRKELERVKHETDRVYKLYVVEALTPEQFKELYQPLDTRKKQLEAELPRLEGDLALMQVEGLSEEMVMREALDLHTRWQTMEGSEKRRIVEILVRSIVLGKDAVTFNVCYAPRIEEMAERQRMVMGSLRRRA